MPLSLYLILKETVECGKKFGIFSNFYHILNLYFKSQNIMTFANESEISFFLKKKKNDESDQVSDSLTFFLPRLFFLLIR
jgi:hypothetical protein